MYTKLILVRHGHSEANRDGYFGGQIESVDLTDIGVRQAERMSEYIRRNYNVDAVYSSTLKRAIRTAEAISVPLGLPVNQDKRLCELYTGLWDGQIFDKVEKKYPEQIKLWRTDMSKVQPPKGENIRDVQKRMVEAVTDIANNNPGKTVAVVTHRVSLRSLQCFWEKRPIEDINLCEWLSNCSVSEINIENGEIIPLNIGQDDFMKELVTKVTSSI